MNAEYPIIKVIIPAYNEADSIGKVITEIPNIVSEIIVVNNNSSDATAKTAANAGATVLNELERGYGNACLRGLKYVDAFETPPDIIVFLDGDYSDYPEKLTEIVSPIIEKNIDLVIGARAKHLQEKGAMTLPQKFGNWLATFLMKIIFNARFTDLGPFRAIKYSKLVSLQMQDKTYGWTVEMQLKALKQKLTYTEVLVPYKKRIGVSKISGTITGAVSAGVKILSWIFKYTFLK